MLLNGCFVENILFIDIETVPIAQRFQDLNVRLQSILKKSYQKEIDRDKENELSFDVLFEKYGGIKSEYSKIICIGLAYLIFDESIQKFSLRKKAFGCDNMDENETDVLRAFGDMIEDKFKQKELIFCGHNIQEFDIPLISRRMLVNGIKLPAKMNYQGKKPWEIKMLDTMKLWSFGDNKNYTSLELLCHIFNIPTPKTELSGDRVKDAYYVDKNVKQIQQYCLADVVATANLLLKMNAMPLIEEALH